MTRIRRINVSQIEGGGADNNDITQIRPNGETAFYLDNNDKLTLMMFDGVRTHQKSKVLSPGVLYGSNADAGDGSTADTIKLIPDAALGSDQYIVVDPTFGEPGHIHIRAGGIQDSSGADLYLGGEQTFVRVSDTYDNVVIRTSTVGEGIIPHSWTFDNNGSLTFPDNSTQTTAYVAEDNVTKTSDTWTVTPGTANYSFTVPANGVYQLWVRGNIPNGIITYTATVSVTNSNVPVVGQQFAWNYTGAGNPILLTSIPDQIIGTAGSISNAAPSVGTTTNTFVFGIQNNTLENVSVNWGYAKIS